VIIVQRSGNPYPKGFPKAQVAVVAKGKQVTLETNANIPRPRRTVLQQSKAQIAVEKGKRKLFSFTRQVSQ
jgi:hypothetical protein